MDELTTTTGIVALAAGALALVALIALAVLAHRVRRLRAAQTVVLGGAGKDDLVAHGQRLQDEFGALHAYVTDVATRLERRLTTAEQRLDGAIAHTALVRYDAYYEMSGRQSTSIALLDARATGIVLTSIHHRDQARLYAKQVVSGEGAIELSPEEAQAVRAALQAPAAQGPAAAAESAG